jgi:hypothetical protein
LKNPKIHITCQTLDSVFSENDLKILLVILNILEKKPSQINLFNITYDYGNNLERKLFNSIIAYVDF